MISDWKTQRKLIDTTAGLHVSFFVFGHPVGRGSYATYILDIDGDYSFYRPRQWNHLCFAWSSGGPSKLVLVGNLIKKLEQSFKTFS